MKTGKYLAEIGRFGWAIAREGGKHLIIENGLIAVDRPLTFCRRDHRDVDPIVVKIQCKSIGLIWDQQTQEAKLNPNHHYYPRYLAALGLSKAA